MLHRVSKEAKTSSYLEFEVGFEIEFCVLDSPNADKPIDTLAQMWTASVHRHPSFKAVEEMVQLLEEENVPIWSFHQEGQGVYEISLCAQDPCTAVDNLVYAQEIIKSVALSTITMSQCTLVLLSLDHSLVNMFTFL